MSKEGWQTSTMSPVDVKHIEAQREIIFNKGFIYTTIGIASGLIIIIFIIGVVFLCRRNNRREQNLAQQSCTVTYETIDSGAAYTALKIGSSGTPIIGSEDLTLFARLSSIGRGDFGEVWKGGLNVSHFHKDVAVRLVSDQVAKSGDFLQAIRVLYELSDQLNVVKCLGYCPEKGSILYEFVSGGTLLTYLQAKRGHSQPTYKNLKPKSERLNDDDEGRLLNMAWQVAKGMEFLVSKKITHGALCAHNVLLADEKLCKISDYGLSTSLFRDKVKLTRWSCPETMATGGQSTEGDIWSFGIVLWEIVTLGSRPYPKMTFDMVQMKVIDGYQMPRPHHCGQEVYAVMAGCWEKEAGKRSSFDLILKSLETILEKAHNYMSLSKIDDGLYESTLDM
ncbi:tyrosine kinase receptor Cad96Ca-like [Lytechinus variegatus]|uniref:tyrosine kinase receptor Cad96Ca-like n=1 Tax=Lytechinus variegatus TaxID=7654 RepID=UPI001BB2942C|nr:tyrosine kinase receptor Cad96Ca-like [Lytechinus variegatus]